MSGGGLCDICHMHPPTQNPPENPLKTTLKGLFISCTVMAAAACTPNPISSSITAVADAMVDSKLPIDSLNLPPGFTIEVLSDEVPNARQMALTDGGTLIVGTRREGKVYALPNALSETPGAVVTLKEDLFMPSGIAVRNGDLYIGAVNSVLRVSDIDNNLQADPAHKVITDALPDETHHGWKYLKFGPDGYLYVPVGAPCNICLSEDPRFATILQMDAATGSTSIWAHGVRNSVGFDWHPKTKELWFSDNGRDWMGDDVPPEELNIAATPGKHFGYPFRHGLDIDDPEFGNNPARPSEPTEPPTVMIQAHSAALGMTFYTNNQFPADYQGALFVAEHGSWNRSEPVGYRVVVVTFGEDGIPLYTPFIEGWLPPAGDGERTPWGRPNDVLVAPDGSLLISDDGAGAIYRVSFQGEQTAAR